MKIKDFCRLILTGGLSDREAASLGGYAAGTAKRYRERMAEESVDLAKLAFISSDALESLINNGRARMRKKFALPDFEYVHRELPKKGITLSLLHEEYAEHAEDEAMSLSEFSRRYHAFARTFGLVMRQPRCPGHQLFIDFSGQRLYLTDRSTGEKTPVEIFVCVLGASRKTFVRAVPSQQAQDWCEANVMALEFFGGVPATLVPDNLKSAVTRWRRGGAGPIINPDYAELASHYDTVVIPARPRKPQDKGPVEVAVKIAQRWILAKLRNRVFHTIAELNLAIDELLAVLNAKPMSGMGGKSRDQLFEELDRPALRSLPAARYEYAEWRNGLIVPKDYHVQWERHLYSVPYRLVGEKVNLRVRANFVDVFHKHDQFPVASHPRIRDEPGGLSTRPEHMPERHRQYGEDTLSAALEWSDAAGAGIALYARELVNKHPNRPAIVVGAIRGLKSLDAEFGNERLNNACSRSVTLKTVSNTSVRSMLDRNLEGLPLLPTAEESPLPPHSNIRGPSSYH